MKIKIILQIVLILTLFSCTSNVSELEKAQKFHKILTKNGGVWVTKVKDTTQPFQYYIMKFNLTEHDTLHGLISGLSENGDTIKFWNVREYINNQTNKVQVAQSGYVGKTFYTANFPYDTVRNTEFEIHFFDDTQQKVKDKHIIMNDSLIITESKMFDKEKNKWIMNSPSEWKRITR